MMVMVIVIIIIIIIIITIIATIRVRWVPCHHDMARTQVVDGGDGLQIWSRAANILNKQSRAADKGWISSLVVGREADNSSS
jgi:hypothetical protein